MSAATKSSTPTAPAAVAPLAPAEAEQLARAEAYLKIEEYVSKQDGVFTKRLADEEEKLFKDLSAIPDLSANTRATDLIKVYFTVGVQVSADRTNLHRFSDLLRKRMSELSAEKTNMLRYALDQRIKALSETHTKEQKEADAVEAEIENVKKRLAKITSLVASNQAAYKKAARKSAPAAQAAPAKKKPAGKAGKLGKP